MKNKGTSLVLLFYFLSFGGPIAAQETESVTEYICTLILEHENGTYSSQDSNGFSVLEETKLNKPFHFPIPTKVKVLAFACNRSSLLPQPNDYKVLMEGHPLALNALQGTNILYDYVDGKFIYVVLQGMLSEKEAREIRKRLLEFQTKYGAF